LISTARPRFSIGAGIGLLVIWATPELAVTMATSGTMIRSVHPRMEPP
jgi:hypothetical protein